MFHRIFAALALLIVAGPAEAGAAESGAAEARAIHYETPGEVPLLSPTWHREPAISILLTDDRLSPRRVEVRQGETVRWKSMARQGSRIVFESEVARSMVCHSLVNFEVRGDQLRSAPIHAGDSASFCRLSPGTYRYRVVRDGPAEHPSPGARQLSTRLDGVIVVRPKAAPVAAR